MTFKNLFLQNLLSIPRINYPRNSDLRNTKVKELEAGLLSHQLNFTKIIEKSKSVTVASLLVCHFLARNKKSFSDGEIFKKTFLETKNKSEIVFSINEITQCSCKPNGPSKFLLKRSINAGSYACQAFSLQLDESTDAVVISQIIVFIRIMFRDFSTKEEILTILPIKGKWRGEGLLLPPKVS